MFMKKKPWGELVVPDEVEVMHWRRIACVHGNLFGTFGAYCGLHITAQYKRINTIQLSVGYKRPRHTTLFILSQ